MSKTVEMIKFWYPSVLFSEDQCVESSWERSYMDVKVPGGAYAFQFYDKVIKYGTLEDGEEITKETEENFSPTYYPDGKICNLKEARNHEDTSRILIDNMICNEWDEVVFHRHGGCIVAHKDDIGYEY